MVALVSCGTGADEAAYDTDGRLICPDLPEDDDPLPQIYVLDLEDPAVLTETYGIEEPGALSVIRRDVVDRSAVHFGWHRGGVVAPVRVWSPLSGVDVTSGMTPFAIDGLRTTDDPCELQRFDAVDGFYDYLAVVGSGSQASQFDVVGASDAFLTEFLGDPRDVMVDDVAVGQLMNDFDDDRSPFTNRRYAVILAVVVLGLLALWLVRILGRRVQARSPRTSTS